MEHPCVHSTETSIFARPLWSLTFFCCRFPAAVLFLSIFLSIFSLYWTYTHLGFKMSRLDLINPNSGFNQLWLDYIDEFGDDNEAIVVVEGSKNSEVIAALNLLTEKIADRSELYQDVLHGVDLSKIKQKGLHYVPIEDLRTIHQFVVHSLRAHDPRSPLSMPSAPMGDVANLLTTLSQSHVTEGDMNYFLFPSQEGVLGFVLLRLINIDKTQFSQGTEAIETLRNIIEKVRSEHSSLKIGLTGMPILEYDEMRLSNDAMTQATLLSFVGVCIVFMAGFGSLRHPILAMLALVAAFTWTMGYTTLAVGHLNILSIAFGAMLIGLGTDFSVHFLGKYLELRQAGMDVIEALCRTAEVVGPGIFTGAITTSAAFYAASFTEFTGVAELGIIVGGGILFCSTATFTMLPSMIVLLTPKTPSKNQRIESLIDIRCTLAPVAKFPKMTLFLFAIGFLCLLPGIPKVWYDHNLLNLQPEGLESVELEQRLLSMDTEKGGKNIWFALSIADTKKELLERKKLFEQKYPELKTEEIVSIFPESDPERIQIIQSLANMLQHEPESMVADFSPTNGAVPPGMAEQFKRFQSLKEMAVAEPPTVKDLPDSLVTRFVGRHGKHLMRIYSTANIWDMDQMEKFVAAVRDIDPKATGSPLQTYESSLQMQSGFITAAWYALAVVLIITWLDFRSLTASLASLLPMVLGFAMMFGIIGLLDLPLNPANMIVLPLVVGIGIDDGIHLMHDFRHRVGKHFTVSSSTVTGILITTLTTFVGFGSMMIASHRGLQSLGRIFVIGIGCCMLVALVVLYAILILYTGGESDEPEQKLSSNRKRLVRRD